MNGERISLMFGNSFNNWIDKIEEIDFVNPFISDDIGHREFTYAQFFELALNTGDYINQNVCGDSVVAVMENSFELALLYFSVMFTSKRIMVVDPQKGKDEIKNILDEIEKTGLFADEKLMLDQISEHMMLTIPRDIISVANNKEKANKVKKTVIEKLAERPLNMPYLVTYTSGTTGVTKGVEHTLNNLFMTALALDEAVMKRDGVFIHVLPMTYMAGILNSLFYPFIVRSKIVITKRFSIISVRNFWNTVIKYNVDLFWLSPSMLMMIDQMDRKTEGEEYCKSRELTFLIGTAPLTNELRIRFNERYGVSVYASYGLSETLFISVENKKTLMISDVNSVGKVLSGVEYKFTDSGEMYIKVPWMYLGYTNEDTNAYFDGDYYKSGDLAKIEDGCLYITGRSKDLIIKGGMNISPVLIENVVNSTEGIIENVVVGIKDKNGEEKVCCAYISDIVADMTEQFESEIKKQVIAVLGKNYMIDFMWKLNSIPRNINGKVDKNRLKQMWETDNGN